MMENSSFREWYDGILKRHYEQRKKEGRDDCLWAVDNERIDALRYELPALQNHNDNAGFEQWLNQLP